MNSQINWRSLGWQHPLWVFVRYFLALRQKAQREAFLNLIKTKRVIQLDENTDFPISSEICDLFAEYLSYRMTQNGLLVAQLRTEQQALLFCSKLGVNVNRTTTKRDHHQSSKAVVATVSEIAKRVCRELQITLDDNPQTRCIWCRSHVMQVSARNIDGAIPGLYNPKIIWEIKEYWGKTNGGSKMSDAVYECHLVGMELRQFEARSGAQVQHVVFVDGKDQWATRKSDLLRLIDLHNQGLIDHLFVGKMIETQWEVFLREDLLS
jgi:hypothetical protein